jgi:hypothetical protein
MSQRRTSQSSKRQVRKWPAEAAGWSKEKEDAPLNSLAVGFLFGHCAFSALIGFVFYSNRCGLLMPS